VESARNPRPDYSITKARPEKTPVVTKARGGARLQAVGAGAPTKKSNYP